MGNIGGLCFMLVNGWLSLISGSEILEMARLGRKTKTNDQLVIVLRLATLPAWPKCYGEALLYCELADAPDVA